MWIERDFLEAFPEIARQQPICVLTGSRQVGKTSLLRHLLPHASFTSLDLPRNSEHAEESGESFLKSLTLPTIIDEAQYAPKLFRYLKHAVDSRPEKSAAYFLTGSERFSMMKNITESLAGRCTIVELQTLSHLELEKWSGKTSEGNQLLEWIFKGGYPDLHARSLDTERFYSDLIATYIERDVKRLSNIASVRDFDRFLRLMALRSGQLLSMNNVANEIGVSQATIKSWTGILVASSIVSLVEPWWNNLSKRLIKTPKMYFHDTGLMCALAGFRSASDLRHSPLLGAIFETHVFGQILRSYANRGLQSRIHFFRTHDGIEADFILQRGTNFHLLECKWSESPKYKPKVVEVFEKASQGKVTRFSIVTSVRGRRKTKEEGVEVRDSIEWGDLHEI